MPILLGVMYACNVYHTLDRPTKISTTNAAVSDDSDQSQMNLIHIRISEIDVCRGAFMFI